MRSSKSRSRNKSNRQRSLGNVVNRVFDSSGPEGKVRGTPQQIIDKYLTLARDAQLSNDRVAEQSFLQHAEHYTRLLGEAQREMAERHQQYQQNQRSGDDDRENGSRQHGGRDNGQRDNFAREGGSRENGQFENARDNHGQHAPQDTNREPTPPRPAPPPAEMTDQPRAESEEKVRQPRAKSQSRPRAERRPAEPAEAKNEQPKLGLPDALGSEDQADPVQFPEVTATGEAPAKAPRKRKTPATKAPAKKTPRKRKSDGEDADTQPGDGAE